MLLLLYPNVCQPIITFLNNVIKRYQNAEKSNPSTWLFNNQLGSAFLSYISLVVFLCAKFPRCFSVALINACIINLLSPLKTFFPCCVKILHLYSLQFKNSFLNLLKCSLNLIFSFLRLLTFSMSFSFCG